MSITQAEVKLIYTYNPETGILSWRQTRKAVGSDSHGHLLMRIFGKNYLVHRVIWLYMEGYFPEHCIDHINGNGHDNRWANLRHVTESCNALNRQAPSTLNTSGFIGVHWSSKSAKWIVTGRVEGHKVYLGGFTSLKEAAEVRIKFEREQPNYDCNSATLNEKRFTELGYGVV